jgi:phytoene dehydrogenase-like protein
MKKKVIIIGAGIAGLSAGCYLQRNGYETTIFEMHSKPGGLCTAWRRNGYIIDNTIHWLVGSSPSDSFYDLWNELIDMSNVRFIDHEEYMRVEDGSANFIRIFTDIDRLEAELLAKATEDKGLILEFTKAVRRFSNLNLPIEKASETYNLWDSIKMLAQILPYIREMRKWSGISAGEYAEQCKNTLLKKTFIYMFLPEMTMFFLVMMMAWMNKKSAGYPIGGSLNFARLLEKSYLTSGGTVSYKSMVKKIITENNSARGVILQNGEHHTADIVVSAADGHYTIFEMLEGKYINDEIKAYYSNYKTFPSYIQVSLGVSRTFKDEPHLSVFELEPPLKIDDGTIADNITLRVMNFDPTLAPDGKTVIMAMFMTANHDYWVNLKNNDIEKYNAEKQRIADAVIDAMEKRFKNIRQDIEVVDVSTPCTVIRYTNNWKGSFEGWILMPEIGFKQMKKTLHGLKDFYMAGQWVEPGGGIPTAMMSGRNVSQIICMNDKKKFAPGAPAVR